MSHSLKLGSPAPIFTASSTDGLINLSDYAGKWVILLCNPTEFNNWRRSELITLMKYAKAFKDINTELLPVICDSKGNHLQWFYSNSRLSSHQVPFPIIDDRNLSIANLYELTNETDTRLDCSTSLFIISPNQTLVKILHYPAIRYAQINEVLNILTSMQKSYRTESHNVDNQPLGTNPLCDVKPIVGEYVLGNPNNVDALLLDFAIYAFALINPDGTLTVYSTKYLKDLANLKTENPYLKVILAIGGWGADGFSDAALTPTSRYAFAREAKKWVDQYNLDGIDIDWEYPGSSASGIVSRPQDKENFTLLLTALRDVLGEDAWLSVAGTGEQSYINNVEISKIAPVINYFNLMAYDFTAGESGENAAKHQSNLYPSVLSLPNTSIDDQVNRLIAAGMPSGKILMGIPFYGRYGASDTRTFDELRKAFINKNGYTVLWDNVAKAPYIVDPNSNFAYSYDNLLSIYYKGLYIKEKCLGGMFSWQSSMDKANILTNGMSQAIRDIGQLEKLLGDAYYLEDKDNN